MAKAILILIAPKDYSRLFYRMRKDWCLAKELAFVSELKHLSDDGNMDKVFFVHKTVQEIILTNADETLKIEIKEVSRESANQ
mgnify:CR=1 FL=1